MALQRGLAMCDALIGNGQPAESLYLAAPKLCLPCSDEAVWTLRVQIALSATESVEGRTARGARPRAGPGAYCAANL